MDSVFVQGIAGFVAAILVFCGSVWLLLALVLGARLAYFVSASVTLSFLLMLGIVWSVGTPLGPVGELPSWNSVGVGETAADIDFGPAGAYPDEGGWRPVSEEDQTESGKAAELEGDASEVFDEAITEKKIAAFKAADDARIQEGSTRLLEQDGTEYGAVTFEPIPPPTPTPGAPTPAVEPEAATDPDARAIVVMSYDPGNPLGKARVITAGTALLFAGHLFGLARAERHARRRGEDGETNGNGNGR